MKPKNKDMMQKNEENEIGIIEIPLELKKNEWIIIGGKKKWIRNCPECNKEIFYSDIRRRNWSKKYNFLCKSCSKIGERNGCFGFGCLFEGTKNHRFGKINSTEHRHKISVNRRGISSGHHSLETKLKIKNSNIGKHHSIPSIETRLRMSKSKIGKKHKNETLIKMRISTLNRIKKQGGIICYNPKACEYFNKLNEEKKWNLQHSKNGGEIECIGYSLDAYDKNLNIVVEYDEPRHYDIYGNLKPKDIKRMDEIKTHLGCKFLRYNEKIKELKEYENKNDT